MSNLATGLSALAGGLEFAQGVKNLFSSGGLSDRKAAALQQSYWRDQMSTQLQLRAEDAKKAGIHPLYAFGAPVNTSVPQVIGGDDAPNQGFSEMGQGISRAMGALVPKEERAASAVMTALQIENAQLQNQRLRAEVSLMEQPGTPPGIGRPTMIPGQGDANVINSPLNRIVSEPNMPSKEAGDITDYTYVNTPSGGLAVIPSSDIKNRIEDSPMEYQWMARHFNNPPMPPASRYPLKPNHKWQFNPITFEWKQVYQKPWKKSYDSKGRLTLY